LKNPALFDTVSRFVLVASSVSSTLAFGMTAPLASAAVPLIDPVAFWANKEELQNRTANSRPRTREVRDVKILVDLIASDMVVPLTKRCDDPNLRNLF
jgi:hypothetical protein